MTVDRALTYRCDAPDCRSTLVMHFSHADANRIPDNWLVDLSSRFHACTSEHAHQVTHAFQRETGKRLLWITYQETV